MKNNLHWGPDSGLLGGYQRASASRWLVSAVAACGLSLVSHLPTQAQVAFPINETFTGTSSSNFTFGAGGTSKPASLTGTATTPGYLRLTDNTTNQAGFAILNKSFASPNGFSISFEFFSYGGTGGTTGADGISVFLVDANGTDPTIAGQFNVGAFGGSLGYAQKTAASGAVTTDVPGVSKGYLGIGLDEFGNFSNPTEGRIGGPGQVPQAVALRGPGTGTTGYNYLTGGAVGFPLSFPTSTTEAQSTSANYRKAYIFVIPVAGGGYNVTVRIQNGPTNVVTTTYNYPISTPPSNLRIGFAGSTGTYTNYHEIRNLNIVQNPVAADDATSTRYYATAKLDVLANDTGVGAALNRATVDLDPTTVGIDNSLTVPGKGTFTVDNNGIVTFTPSGTFAGIVSIPYTVNDLLGSVSNPATITVTVTGADVATSVSGPATANPGAQVTYTVNTTNLGSETATNVSPTLQLPTGLTVPTSTDNSYTLSTNTSGTLVTFSPITLASNGTTSNSITLTAPSSGSITATSNYTYGSNPVVPDPATANNSATLTTNIAGPSSAAAVCATPGKDGPGALTTAGPNTYYPGTSVTTANSVSIINVGTAVGSTPVAPGDLVLIMQMQDGANMLTPNTASYGTFNSTGTKAGQYEYAVVASVSGTPASSIILNRTLTNTYSTSTNQNFQVIRIPQYSSLAVSGVVTGTAWDSQNKVGGVLALDVAGATTFSGTAGLSMTAKGFAGGGGVSYNGLSGTTNTPTVYATSSTNLPAHGAKGEGVAGTPRYFYNGTAVASNATDGYATGDNNQGAPANGGGGAQDFAPATNTGNAGGGGGANLVAGGKGGYGFNSNSTGNLAVGGQGVATGSPSVLIMGGGGGAGSVKNGTALNSSGGVGGGIIILRTGTVSGTATIRADGGDAPSTAANATAQGGGGGGAGGTALVLATPATGTGSLAGITASATGGNGGSVNLVSKGASYGPGGGGSGGAIYANTTLSATTTGGNSGQTTDGSQNKTTSFGATNGTTGTAAPSTAATPPTTTAPSATATIGGAGSCIPALAVELTTATPNVTRNSPSTAPTPAQYTATISNTGGTAQNTSTTLTMDPLFKQDNSVAPMVTLTSASGANTTLTSYTLTGQGTSTLVLSGITIPAGSTLKISYQAIIDASAANGTAYQASGSVAFIDPTRTSTTGTVSPGGNFASGGGTAPGTNYAAASSTLEDVTIVTPLPVELTRFTVLAVRQDALLTWSTASERNNDHFTVERSLTGSNFVAVGTMRGQGTSLRNTDYTFTDPNAGRLASNTLYYRLKQVDLDGTATYSPVRTVQFGATAKAGATLYPNPSQGQIVLDLSGLAEGSYSVQVLDLTGRVLRSQQSTAQAATLDLSGLPQGAYMVLVQGAGVRQALPLLRN